MRDDRGYPLPIEIGPQELMWDAAPELKQRGQWLCFNIEPNVTWPVRPQSVEFGGNRVWIIPITSEHYPGVAIRRTPEMSQEDAESILYRFLSVLSWREGAGITVAFRTGGSIVQMMGLEKKFGLSIRTDFDFTDMICPEDEGPRVALALMREARSLNHYGYAFLSFWRILELAFPKTSGRVHWMDATLANLKGRGIDEALKSITDQGITDVGRHLFESGRCAIAHATGRPIINPDDPRDARRLYQELPIVRELAIQAIEQRYGIETPFTQYRNHLYELRGWKAALGEDIVSSVLEGKEPQQNAKIEVPIINLRLRESKAYAPFERMNPKRALQLGQELQLVYQTDDGLAEIRFRLAFAEERLKFDVFNGVFGHDDGSVRAAEYRREIGRFFRDYLLNGELQMWDADSGVLLSRLDSYMPVNMMVDLEACNANITAAEAEIERRLATAGQG